MDFETYSRESARTASGGFHQEVITPFLLKEVLSNILRTGSILDQCKKGLFYGRPIKTEDLWGNKGEGNPDPIDPLLIDKDLLHAAMGVATEAVEILEALLKAMEGHPIDRVNLIEEMGDVEWYMAMLYRALETTPEAVREINIAKLRARFPEKFTEEEAIDRNTDRERSVLESAQCKEVRLLHIRGQKSFHDEVRISGNRRALLILSEAIRLAAWNDAEVTTGHFYPSDGEGYEVVVEPVTEEDFQKRSVHYCDHRDNERLSFFEREQDESSGH